MNLPRLPVDLHPALRALLARTFLPTMLVASVSAYAFAPLAGLPAESAVIAVGIVTLLLAVLLWDHVFGTYRAVAHAGHAPEHIGLYAPSHYPARAGYVRQVLSMFTPACCKAGAA